MPSNPKKSSKKSMGRSVEQSWEAVMKKVDRIDDSMTDGWKDDIDTLLVFAGLFSAVVTAFLIESYKWLSQAPEDTATMLLTQISRQLSGQNITIMESTPPFSPTSSSIRINAFWFLSLILALVDALFGLVCKQWLREYKRPATTKTSEQNLALRCFRVEGFRRWHVPEFLAALPIILEVALFCFLAGLLELLWMRNLILFVIAVILVGIACIFYIGTTLLPAVDIVRLALTVHPELHEPTFEPSKAILNLPAMNYLCPYKSPQARAVFTLVSRILDLSFCQRTLSHSIMRRFRMEKPQSPYQFEEHEWKCRWSIDKNLHQLRDWALTDLNIIQRYSKINSCPDMYALRAIRWLVQEFQDSPSMLPHLHRILSALDPRVVMPAVFERQIVHSDRDWHITDVEQALQGRSPIEYWRSFTFTQLEMQLLYYHSLWVTSLLKRDSASIRSVTCIPAPFEWSHSGALPWSCLQIPFERILLLFETRDRELYKVGISYLKHYQQHGPLALENLDQVKPLLERLSSKDFLRTGSEDPYILRFLDSLNRALVTHGSFSDVEFRGKYHITIYDWIDALHHISTTRALSFTRHGGHFPLSMRLLNTLLRDATSFNYAVECIRECTAVWDDEGMEATVHDIADFVYQNISPIRAAGGPPEIENIDWKSLSKALDWAITSGGSSDELPLLTTKVGISLLRYVNGRISDRGVTLRLYQAMAWNHAVECVQSIRKGSSTRHRRLKPIPIPLHDVDGKPLHPYCATSRVRFGGSGKHSRRTGPESAIDASSLPSSNATCVATSASTDGEVQKDSGDVRVH